MGSGGILGREARLRRAAALIGVALTVGGIGAVVAVSTASPNAFASSFQNLNSTYGIALEHEATLYGHGTQTVELGAGSGRFLGFACISHRAHRAALEQGGSALAATCDLVHASGTYLPTGRREIVVHVVAGPTTRWAMEVGTPIAVCSTNSGALKRCGTL